MNVITEYAKKIAEENLCGGGDVISMKKGGKIYATRKGVDFSTITDDDVIEVNDENKKDYELFLSIYGMKADVNAICAVHPKWVSAVSEKGCPIPAVLDDMAQIVGPTCKIAKNEKEVLKVLKGRNSCLLKGDGCVTTGRTMDEAHTCVLVLDKASRCFVAGSVLGGNKIIPFAEAKLMQIIYKKKYSKVNQQNLHEREE